MCVVQNLPTDAKELVTLIADTDVLVAAETSQLAVVLSRLEGKAYAISVLAAAGVRPVERKSVIDAAALAAP